MRRLFGIFLVGVLACSMAACFRPRERTHIVSVPALKPANEAIVLGSLSNLDGFISCKADQSSHRVSVTYVPEKLGMRNIEFAIAGVGFDANATPASADARAKLPANLK